MNETLRNSLPGILIVIIMVGVFGLVMFESNKNSEIRHNTMIEFCEEHNMEYVSRMMGNSFKCIDDTHLNTYQYYADGKYFTLLTSEEILKLEGD